MKKIQNGIYRFDGEIESNKTPLVLVHPWYEEKRNKFEIFREREKHLQMIPIEENHYLTNLNNLLQKCPNRNIFLFEEYASVEKSCKRISDISGRSKGIHAIETSEGCSFPYKSSWDDVTNFIGQFSKDIAIAGGYVYERQWASQKFYCGCAGGVYEKFKEKEFRPKFIEGCCFC